MPASSCKMELHGRYERAAQRETFQSLPHQLNVYTLSSAFIPKRSVVLKAARRLGQGTRKTILTTAAVQLEARFLDPGDDVQPGPVGGEEAQPRGRLAPDQHRHGPHAEHAAHVLRVAHHIEGEAVDPGDLVAQLEAVVHARVADGTVNANVEGLEAHYCWSDWSGTLQAENDASD